MLHIQEQWLTRIEMSTRWCKSSAFSLTLPCTIVPQFEEKKILLEEEGNPFTHSFIQQIFVEHLLMNK